MYYISFFVVSLHHAERNWRVCGYVHPQKMVCCLKSYCLCCIFSVGWWTGEPVCVFYSWSYSLEQSFHSSIGNVWKWRTTHVRHLDILFCYKEGTDGIIKDSSDSYPHFYDLMVVGGVSECMLNWKHGVTWYQLVPLVTLSFTL